VTCALALLLTACGGGGSGGSAGSAPPPANAAPTAEAGDAQSVAIGERVQLDGSASADSDGIIESFAWTQTDGPSAELEGSDSANASFTAPQVSVDAELVFSLTVTDDDGATATDSVSVTVAATTVVGRVDVGGRLLLSTSQSLDGDTNDPFNTLFVNDDPDNPQRIGNPTTLGGYVNEAGRGAEGRSQIEGDPEDFFLVDLLEGQNLDLIVAEFQDADADLYLYSDRGELIDFSIGTGQRESISAPATARYLVNVSIFSGATNYTLTIGSRLEPEARGDADIVPGEAIVSFDEPAPGRPVLDASLRLRQVGGGPRRARRFVMEGMLGDLITRRSRLGDQAYRRDEFRDPERARRWETLLAIKQLARRPGIVSAEPNYRVYPLASVNDDAYRFQWHYPAINLPGAWDTTTGSAEVVVAVVDTGVLQGHPDLRGQLVDGYDFISDAAEAGDGDGIDPDPEENVGGSDPDAINFHGTHVAGTVAARGNNGIGVAGVAFGARVMPLRALTASGGTLFDINQAIRYAAGLPNDSGTLPARPADIINLSLGGGGFSPSSQALYNELRNLGITVVAAAGNEGSRTPSYPASYDNVISVSAVDVEQRITSYSNRGSRVDIAAPGGDGSVDLNGDGYPDGVLSTGGSDGGFAYTFLSGTSMAAPHVAGVLALMKSVNPDLDADDFDRLLADGALTDDLGDAGRDDLYGHGLIDARRAIDAALLAAGADIDIPPRLAASTSALNFGSVATRLDIVLRNAGGGELTDVSLEALDSWLSVSPADTDANGLGRYSIRVARGELAPGLYEGSLEARAAQDQLRIRVLVSVLDARDSELGQLYLLLIDPNSDEAVDQTVATRDGDAYRYRFRSVPAGRYQVFAGSDLDNDLLICDAGEACGSYLTIDQPLSIELNGDRDDLDFPVEYFIALPGTATGSSSGTIARYPSLKRRP
jgi:serine protease